MPDSVEVSRDLAWRMAVRMEWAAEYIGEAGGRGHTGSRVAELWEYAATLRDETGEQKEPEDDVDLPPGYSAEHTSGGYYSVTDAEGNAVEGPSNGKWQGKDGASEGAWSHYNA